VAAGIAVAALLAAGCGTGGVAAGNADQQNGEKLFQAKCAGCHTLAAAGANGKIGPSLDAAFAYDRSQGFKDSSIENVVLDQIRLGSGPVEGGSADTVQEPRMPANIVTGQDAGDVAAYVAAVAGQGGAEAQQPSALGTDGKAIFQAECASCHTLQAAGATGTVGPNLDQVKPAFARVQHQVEVGGAVMPSFQGTLSQAQIDAVAKYVSSSAGS
jgi:cbb3-type cytochrome c oxidase subunit III